MTMYRMTYHGICVPPVCTHPAKSQEMNKKTAAVRIRNFSHFLLQCQVCANIRGGLASFFMLVPILSYVLYSQFPSFVCTIWAFPSWQNNNISKIRDLIKGGEETTTSMWPQIWATTTVRGRENRRAKTIKGIKKKSTCTSYFSKFFRTNCEIQNFGRSACGSERPILIPSNIYIYMHSHASNEAKRQHMSGIKHSTTIRAERHEQYLVREPTILWIVESKKLHGTWRESPKK